ncbi:LytTr DNA-binding domain-containing protein [Tenacibaculum sp. MAR_2009_124]|uniref:LytTR family DNA-binding domain-containing protein n=1 Tax=Tenacibaculum sp. MAR_2009_124 TaxID=1250059 RepID=UPI00089CB411|nr:LytTR family DNA-binding domain-containing protein [Tenacibaculum sp. MAR_2009_124]SEC92699.1 LytTr DNA-binding domain-containing protein [Tenacibaculum sp. MAR_2009_124]
MNEQSSSIAGLFDTKHYRPNELYNKKKSVIFTFITTFLLIQLFPFSNITFKELTSQLFTSVVFATLASSSYLINYYIFKPTKRTPWLYKHEIFYHLSIFFGVFFLINIFACLFLNLSLKYIVQSTSTFSYSFEFVLKSFFYTVVFGVVFYILINFFDLVRYITNKTKLNIDLEGETAEILDLRGKNKNERLVIPSSNLIYMKSEGHYVNIYYTQLDKQKLNNVIFRSSMNEIEKTLNQHESIIRCHKSYFINLIHIKAINYYGKKFYAIVNGFNKRIPIALDKVELLKESINQ